MKCVPVICLLGYTTPMRLMWFRILVLFLIGSCSANLLFTINCDDEVIKENIENRLKNYTLRFNEINQNNVDKIYNGAIRQVRSAMEPFGYFQPNIKSELLTSNNQYLIAFDVQKGLRSIIGDIYLKFDKKMLDEHKGVFSALYALSDQPYDGEKIAKIQSDIKNYFSNRGYIFAEFNQSFIKQRGKIVDLNFILNLHQQFFFGPITYTRKNNLSTKFLNRFLNFKPGEPFNSQKVNDLQQNLSRSNYFSQIGVRQQSEEGYNIPIEIDLTDVTPKRSTYSIGYDSFFDFGFGYGYSILPSNSMGHSIQFVGKVTTNNFYNFLSSYHIPAKDPVTTEYVLSLAYINLELAEGLSKKAIATLSRNYFNNGFLFQPSINFAVERSKPSNESSFNTYLTYPRLNTGYQWSNSEGIISSARFNLDSILTSKVLLSKVDLARFHFQSEAIIPLSFFNLRLASELGKYESSSNDEVPLSLNFFTGGPDTLRGYRFFSIGPGKYLKTFNYELQFPVRPFWSFIVFQDRGVAADEWDAAMKVGTGVGVMWSSSFIGLKLSLAKAEDDPGQPLRVQFSVQTI